MKKYVIYDTDEVDNGGMHMVEAEDLQELLEDEYDFETESTELDDIIYDFEYQCGENGTTCSIFDVEAKKNVINI